MCGAKVVICGFEADEVEQVAQQIKGITGEMPFTLTGNLTENGFAEKLVKNTVEHYGRIDVLVNNAGRACTGDSFLDKELMNQYSTLMDLNLKTVIKMIHLCVPHLEATKGNIVNVSSIAGFAPLRMPLYSASKAAVNMITKVAAVELGEKGIRCNSVNPGPIKTNIGRSVGVPKLLLSETSELSNHTIMQRNGEPDEVANLVLFLASNETSSYITGVNNLVDGGYMCL
ncbi:PREDICTED: 3-oxoacyl-[acyl-carrier-protein] reductase FabG-like [Rhagoletis zephyria]|uniref:3-oxoacyl-[acyl-carrier-protein] reductase FabG-like n=1 Tax=Rhagoletis zephyria TaxID=28612 RepID=UPI0008118D7B|nr:PREDICTED: 3-oxoacyl-[acyl-carrier-protein] reductase FabG-like [Rhagoletis zephyria]